MTPKLYTVSNDYASRLAKQLAGNLVAHRDVSNDWDELWQDCADRGVCAHLAEEPPILVTDGRVYFGPEALGEIKQRAAR